MSDCITAPFGVIPDDWQYVKINDSMSYLTGPAFDSDFFNMEGSGSRLVRGINLTVGSTRWAVDKTKYWNEDLEQYNKYELVEEDILIGMDGSLVGRNYAYLSTSDLPALLVQRVARLRSNGSAESKFVYYTFGSDSWLKYVDTVKTNSGIPHISNGDIKGFLVPFPPLPEQQKIAKILSAVDEVIEATRAQIEKLKNLKTGMMQELLSPREGSRQAELMGYSEFKDSAVGRIPVGWGCRLLDEVAKRGSGHTPDKQKTEYWNGGIKWISLSDSYRLDKLYINETNKYISELGIINSSAVIHPKGTVVISRDAGIGKSAITEDEMAVSQHFIAWTCSSSYNNYFLYYLLQLWKPRFEAIAMGSTIKTIGLPFFKKLSIPVPPISTQESIAASLKSIDENFFKLSQKLTCHQNLKKSVMQDLLTGKVRVKVDPQ